MNKNIMAFCTTVALLLISQATFAGEAMRLTDGQMDAITGGKASVQIGANASGFGKNPHAGAHTNTYAHQYNGQYATVDVSFGYGYAHGSGSKGSNAQVSVNANASGDITHTDTSTSAYSSPYSSAAYGWGSSVSVTFH